MKRYFFHIAYNGTGYHGWQRQPGGVKTVQQTLEESMGKLLKKDVSVWGCGRTDAGVHARQFFFHLDLKKKLDDDFLFGLNKVLPVDVAVFDIIEAAPSHHAQFGATERTYDYFIHTYKDPFLPYSSSLYELDKLDLESMKEAMGLFIQHTDFKAFCKSPEKHNHTICEVKTIKLFADKDKGKLRFQVTANRFLRGMVRILVGRLLEVGMGRLSINQLETYFQGTCTPKFLNRAYPQGLYLSKVTYPFLDIAPKAGLLKFDNLLWEEV